MTLSAGRHEAKHNMKTRKGLQDEGQNQPVSNEDPPPSPPRPKVLDGGWGWVCAVSCCLIGVLTGGLNASFSIIFLTLIERFDQSAAVTALTMSIYMTFVMLGGPVAAALIKRFGCRRCLAVAGVMYCAGFICTGFAPSLVTIYLSLSIIPGAAGSTLFTTVFVIIGEYFDKNRSKAIAIALIGRGIGAIVFPIFLQTLLETFGFTGAFLVMGGCFLNIVPLGMLLRPPDVKCNSPDQMVADRTQATKDAPSGGSSDEFESFELLNRENETHRPETIDTVQNQPTTPKQRSSCCTKVLNALDLKLLKETANLAFFCHVIFLALSFSIVASCIAGLAKELGVSKRETAWCLSAFGITSILTRIIAGVVFDLKALRPFRIQLYATNLFLFGSLLLAVPMLYNFLTLTIFVMLFGLFFSVSTNQEMVILADLVSKSRYASAVGLSTAFKGIGTLLGPPLGGLLRDITGSFVTSYLIAAGSGFVAFFVCGIIVCRKTPCCQKHTSCDKNLDPQPVDT